MNEQNSLLTSPQLANYEQLAALALSSKQIQSLYKKSKASGFPMETLEQIYYRGYTAATELKEQAGFARVDSFIHGGEAARIDEDLLEGVKALAKQIAKDIAHVAFPGARKIKHKVHKVKKHKYISKLRENVVQGEPISDDPNEPASRFTGTDKLTQIYKDQTPGQGESRADVIKRIVRDKINTDKKDPE
jgi:hypothetical protein